MREGGIRLAVYDAAFMDFFPFTIHHHHGHLLHQEHLLRRLSHGDDQEGDLFGSVECVAAVAHDSRVRDGVFSVRSALRLTGNRYTQYVGSYRAYATLSLFPQWLGIPAHRSRSHHHLHPPSLTTHPEPPPPPPPPHSTCTESTMAEPQFWPS